MPPRKQINRKPAAETRADAPVQQQAQAQAPSRGEQARDEVRRQKALDSLPKGYAEFMKEKLGVDVNDRRQVSDSNLFDLIQGKVTSPMELIVTPLAYDREKGANVQMPKVKLMTSLRVEFPRDRDTRQFVPIDSEHPARVSTVPCLPYREKAEGYEADSPAQAPAAQRGAKEGPTFTETQLRALEGIGIDRNRLFAGPNPFNREEKEAIASGEKFFFTGAVNTDAGLLRVAGEGKLSGDRALFETSYPEKRGENLVLDITEARKIDLVTKDEGRAVLMLDFLERDAYGRAKTDVNRQPKLNQAGTNLVQYGMAMEPVVGVIRYRAKNGEGKWEVKDGEPRHYQVTALNGSLHVTPMKEVKDLAPDGSVITYKDRKGNTVEQTHPEIYNPMVKDGKVYVDGFTAKGASRVDFASKEDEANYRQGRAAVVKGHVFYDHGAKKEVTYDAVVVADNRKAGFAHAFSPSVSKALREKLQPSKPVRKKQNFSLHM